MIVSEEQTGTDFDVIGHTSDLVSAFVSNNHVAVADLPSLISSVHRALLGLSRNNPETASATPASDKPALAQIKKSIQPDGLVSFIDGKTYKTLKRHLSSHGLDPDSYRARYGLPFDYPMVALAYSEKRSNLAKSLGLGRFRDAKPQEVEVKPAAKEGKKAARAKASA